MDPALIKEVARVLVPIGAVSAVAFAAAWWPARGRPLLPGGMVASADRSSRSWRAALAPALLGAGVVAAHVLITGGVALVPHSAFDLIPHAGVVGGLAGVVHAWASGSPAGGRLVLVRLLLLLGVGAALMYRQLASQPAMESLAWVLGFAGAATALWCTLERTLNEPGAFGPALLVLLGGSSMMVFTLTGSESVGRTAGALAAVALPAGVVALLRPRLVLGAGAAAPVAVAWCTLLFLHARLNAPDTAAFGHLAALLLAVPITAWLAGLPGVTERAGWKRDAARLALSALPAGLAVGAVVGLIREYA